MSTSQGPLVRGAVRAVWELGRLEASEGTLIRTLGRTLRDRRSSFARDYGFGELLEWAARRHGSRLFVEYGDEGWSFDEMNRRANRVAAALRDAGVREGTGVALFLSNHPRFLDAFFAVQKLGAYAIPVNTALLGDGLAFVLDDSEASAIVCDHETIARLEAIRDQAPGVAHVWVNDAEAPPEFAVPEFARSFDELERGPLGAAADLGVVPTPSAPSLLLYTSGTTGRPKAVMALHGQSRVKTTAIVAHLLADQSDKLYTCLPLFHANALLLTTVQALWVGIPVHLARRFSASRFWTEVAACGATQFNTVGSMIPVLLKTPPSEADRAHRVHRVVSAACPEDVWVPFEERFGVVIWEAYGAVDVPGLAIFNAGTAPVGSLGRPARMLRWRLVDETGSDVPQGEPGELWVHVGAKADSKVQYWKDARSSAEKVVDGWLRTGDLMQADDRGFLYFVGRNTDSMRRRGENVSAFEVEKAVDAYPDVLESAAFGVPSTLGEQDVMITVVPVDGRTLDVAALAAFLRERLPRYAVPAYLDVVAELPKTGTHRVIKAELRRRGVTERTIRLEPGGRAES